MTAFTPTHAEIKWQERKARAVLLTALLWCSAAHAASRSAACCITTHTCYHFLTKKKKNLLCQQPAQIPALITILLIAISGRGAIHHTEQTSRNTSQPGQKNIIMQFILSPCQCNTQHYLFNGLIILNYSFLQH